MITRKSWPEIELLAQGGAMLAQVLKQLESETKAGVTGKQLDARARELLKELKVEPSFLGYASKGHPPFPAALCVSVNEDVVHGLPNDKPFKDGDVVKLDLGLIYKGMYLDSAHTVIIGKGSVEARRLLAVTKEAIKIGIEAAQVGNTTGHIGEAVQTYVEEQGFGVVRQLVGHGVGYAVHEDGMVIAIEPMVTVGDYNVTTAADGWTVKTVDDSLSAHEEHTVAITGQGPKVLT
jgi:methionyl aminopeptidase